MRSFGVVVAAPWRELDADLGKRAEQRLVQELVAQAAIEALDEGVLLRLAGLDVVLVETMALRPAEHRQAGELGVIVGDTLPGQPAGGDQGLQLADHARPPGSEVSATRHRFSRV